MVLTRWWRDLRQSQVVEDIEFDSGRGGGFLVLTEQQHIVVMVGVWVVQFIISMFVLFFVNVVVDHDMVVAVVSVQVRYLAVVLV